MEPNKSLGLLSIARKAGKIELGEAPVLAAAKLGKARLIVLASDAGEAICKKTALLTDGTKRLSLTVPFTKAALGGAMGYSPTAVAAFTDAALAASFVRTLEPAAQYAALLEALEARAARFQKRAGTKKHKPAKH